MLVLQTARTQGFPPGEAVGQAAKRPPRAGRLEDGAEVEGRLGPNPEARRGRSEPQTTIGTDSPDTILITVLLSCPGSASGSRLSELYA
jgi:hypothetical protein